jgi:hypothetical protein
VFDASEGQRMGFGATNWVQAGGSAPVSIKLQTPNRQISNGHSCSIPAVTCGLSLGSLQDGRYVVIVEPVDGIQAMEFEAYLSTDFEAELAYDTPYALSIGRVGQNARLTFTGSAGQLLFLWVSGQSTIPSGKTVYYNIYRPSGSHWSGFQTTSSSNINLSALPQTGEYTIIVTPLSGETMSAQVGYRQR